MAAPDGLLVVDKPAGWTSHDVVARCRRLCETRRVGHAGTLDPMATGVLVLGVGKATRLLGRLALADKAYEATIRLGQSTVTDDAEGDLLETVDAGAVSEAALAAAVADLTGDIEQRPSAVSAIKVDGERAYKRVRAGEDVVLAERSVDRLVVRRAGGTTGCGPGGRRRLGGVHHRDLRPGAGAGPRRRPRRRRAPDEAAPHQGRAVRR